MGRCSFYCQGRSQPRRSGGAPASGRWARGWVRTNVSPSTVGTLGIFLYIFSTKSCILMHSLAPKIGITSVLSRPLCIGEMKTAGRGFQMRSKGPKIKAEGGVGFLGRGQQVPPARRPCSDVNKTNFLRPRPK